MKQNIIVFGTGSYFQSKKKNIYDKYNVLAFADNNIKIQKTILDGRKVISPHDIDSFEYDKIFIASSFFFDIAYQLVNIGVKADMIELGINFEPLLNNEILLKNKNMSFTVTKNGKIRCKINDIKFDIHTENEYCIVNEIFGDKIYNFEYQAEDIICLDIGMNIGIASLFLAENDKIKKIYGFEPFPDTYNLCLENLDLNSSSIKNKIITNNYGLYDSDKNMTAEYNFDMKGCMSVEESNIKKIGKNEEFKEVNIVLKKASNIIKKIISENSGYKFVCKIDCEGSEYKILKNLQKEDVLKFFNIFIIEWHGKDRFEKVKNILKNNYYLYNCYPYKNITGILCAFKYHN